MNEENQDPELTPVTAAWSAPSPNKDFHARMQKAYDREFRRSPWWRRWPVVAAAAAAGLLVAIVVVPRGPRYEPVQQPRFIIISQGEHP